MPGAPPRTPATSALRPSRPATSAPLPHPETAPTGHSAHPGPRAKRRSAVMTGATPRTPATSALRPSRPATSAPLPHSETAPTGHSAHPGPRAKRRPLPTGHFGTFAAPRNRTNRPVGASGPRRDAEVQLCRVRHPAHPPQVHFGQADRPLRHLCRTPKPHQSASQRIWGRARSAARCRPATSAPLPHPETAPIDHSAHPGPRADPATRPAQRRAATRRSCRPARGCCTAREPAAPRRCGRRPPAACPGSSCSCPRSG